MSLLQAVGEIPWHHGLELELQLQLERDPLQRSSLVSVAESLLQAVGEIPWRRGLDLELEWDPCSGAAWRWRSPLLKIGLQNGVILMPEASKRRRFDVVFFLKKFKIN